MYSKLTQLEYKLNKIDLEDLYRLEIDSSDSNYLDLLHKFIEKYGPSYKIQESLGDKRDLLVYKLTRKLEIIVETKIMAEMIDESTKKGNYFSFNTL